MSNRYWGVASFICALSLFSGVRASATTIYAYNLEISGTKVAQDTKVTMLELAQILTKWSLVSKCVDLRGDESGHIQLYTNSPLYPSIVEGTILKKFEKRLSLGLGSQVKVLPTVVQKDITLVENTEHDAPVSTASLPSVIKAQAPSCRTGLMKDSYLDPTEFGVRPSNTFSLRDKKNNVIYTPASPPQILLGKRSGRDVVGSSQKTIHIE